ncbi:hypothetical protein PFICI_03186 [Pestalotiopsis fici W106-1]|uniref:Uncharacterized protein n=1 Tax=Pestalotiopsis fici (strain W106-1 / CGMCC3.15140) TaxID=1229662 RepID=W3XIV8_PESFW|nr:uncharacterized protein PFICI_03186 [Pestalotiopsis fici W106-1]ETS85161.1 hypothetical protein PFICI_03186 [Pestalotiopsis fici W106-1]
MSHLKLYVDHRKNLTQPSFDDTIWDMVGDLDEMAALKDSPTWAAEAYRNAIASLKEWVRETDSRPRSWAHFFRWPGVVSNDYVQLLAARDDTALTIFVYWCMIMNRSPKRWFMEDWACRDSSAAIQAMRDSSSHVLALPREAINVWRQSKTCGR